MKQDIQFALSNLQDDLTKIISNDLYLDRLEELSKIFRRAIDNRYRIFFTGVGKTSFAAHKLSCTAKSIGIKSEYLDCQNAGHGDIGSLPEIKQCFCIYLSKSGSTKEHFELAKLISRLRPNCQNIMICFSSDEHAKYLTDNQDITGMHKVINIPIDIMESDGFGILPTNSNALFEACISGSMVSAGLVDKISMFEALEHNHPSGSLHEKVTKQLTKFDDIIK